MSTELALISPATPTVLCARQDQIEITFDDDGNASITQANWPEEDQVIRISRNNVDSFLDRLCDAFGVPTFGGAR